MTKVLFVDDGIEFDSITIRNKPSGGAETAFVSLVEALVKVGIEVVVYNNAKNIGEINGVTWKKLSPKINDEKFDAIVINRGDRYLNFKKECKKRIFWIHNPANYLLKWRYLSKIFFNLPVIVFSSEYHLKTYPLWAPYKNKVIIPYGIDEFILQKKKSQTIPSPSAIFTSNPLRGLNWLLDRWENEIFPKVPGAKLYLYTGYNTYGSFGLKHVNQMKPIIDRARNLERKGVILKKPIERNLLINKVLESRLFLYQGSKDETFCMSVAEAQVLGVPAVVCDLGCLNERVQNEKTGYVSEDNTNFSKSAIKLLTDDNCWKAINKNLKDNKKYFTWNTVARQWKEIIV